MTMKENAEMQPESKKSWRYYVGLFLFVLSFTLPLLALIIVPLLGVSAGVSALLYGLSVAGVPDLLLVAATAFLGKENLEYLFSKLGSGFKNFVRWDQVSHKRYKVGLWLMFLSVVMTFILFYIFPETLANGNQPSWGFYVTIGADFLFIISFFILGGEFWAKIRALFQYNAHVIEDLK